MLVDFAEVARQPAVRRRLVQRARRARHGCHDRQHQGQNHHGNQHVGDDRAGSDDAGHGRCNAHTRINIGSQDAVVHRVGDRAICADHGLCHDIAKSEIALEGQRYQNKHCNTQQAAEEDGLEGIVFRVFEFTGVADRSLKAVRGPGGDKQATGHQGPTGGIPRAVNGQPLVPCQRIDRQQVGQRLRADHIARDQRHHGHQHQRKQRSNGQDFLGLGRAQDAAMLDPEHRQQNGGTQHKGCIDAQRQTGFDGTQIQQGDLPGVDRRIRRKQRQQHVARCQTGTDRQHRRPRKPVAPDRDRRNEFAVAQPGHRTVDRRTA